MRLPPTSWARHLHTTSLLPKSQAAEIARQSDELKSALLQSVSHDLRTPLATIRAAAGSLRTDSGLTDTERDESAAAIDREVEYLNRMVTNLLDLSRIEAGALTAERDIFELDDLVNRSLERLRRRLGDRPLEINLDAPPVVVDPIFLDSSVTNIIENAIKYTPPDAPMRISAGALDDTFVRLTIEDGGPGVPPEAYEKLFEKFYRVPGQQRTSRSGTGIGLAVVRGLVETMGGRVEARRSELGGLAIDIDVPAASKPGEAISEARAACRSRRLTERPMGPSVLVIEDDDETRAVLVRDLRSRGYRPVEAFDGRSALSKWEARRPDVVLLDLGLPDIEGIQLIRRIRRDAATPIVILSARYEERQKVEALDAGADDYLTKPFGVDELNARLRVALRHSAGRTPSDAAHLRIGPLLLDIEGHDVSVDGRSIDLTPREFEILRVLMTNPGRLVTKAKLLRAVWGEAYQTEDSYVYVYVSQLRRKLATADATGRLDQLIVTEPGVGYRIRLPEDLAP